MSQCKLCNCDFVKGFKNNKLDKRNLNVKLRRTDCSVPDALVSLRQFTVMIQFLSLFIGVTIRQTSIVDS